SITLSGTATDADGTITNYTWVKISGPAAGVIASPGTAATAINNLVQGVYQYMLTVTDNNGAVSRDTVKVTVNAAINKAPVANAGTDKVIMLPTNSTTLSGTATDSDGTIASYSWIKVSGPTAGTIALPNAATSAVNNMVQGVYQFQLTVTDNSGASSKDTVMITVNAATNLPPAANAGPDKVITLPLNITSLTGTGTDADGTVTGYSWVKISGPTGGTVGSPNNAATAVTGLIQGVYQYQLTVTDNKGLTGKDTVLITVNPIHNDVPVVNAGADIDLVLPTNSASIKGSAVDNDGTIAKYTWKVVSGPAGYVILDQGISQTTIDSLFQGVYEVELTAWDNKGASASDTMKITVSAPRLAPNTANSAKVYPNPVVDVANVSISTINANTKVSVAISTVLGMQVKYSEFVTTSTNTIYPLNMSNLSQAYYFVTVRFEDGQKITYKILKSR
ncbi:MAG: tandem-95 repeat protein, partial [Ferruginibacter sp.]